MYSQVDINASKTCLSKRPTYSFACLRFLREKNIGGSKVMRVNNIREQSPWDNGRCNTFEKDPLEPTEIGS